MSKRAEANRRRREALTKPTKTVIGWMEFETAREIIDRRTWSNAIKGLPKDKVPIARIKWLERPMP